MRAIIVGDLIAHSCRHCESATVLQLCFQLSIKHEKNVPFAAPVIGEVAGAVLNQAHTDGSTLLRAPSRHASGAAMLLAQNIGPVSNSKRNIADLHTNKLSQHTSVEETEQTAAKRRAFTNL